MSALSRPAWLEAVLEPTVARGLDAVLPDGVPTRSPAIVRTTLARVAHEAYQQGRADAIQELVPSDTAAATLGVSVRRVRVLAQSRGVGWRIGRDILFRPEDVDALRDRRPGRRRAASAEPLP